MDSGLTLKYLLKNLAARKPASLEVAALLRKTGLQKVPLDLRYVGFEIPPEFVVGYGLDFAERYRNLPYVATLKPEAYGGSYERRSPAGDRHAGGLVRGRCYHRLESPRPATRRGFRRIFPAEERTLSQPPETPLKKIARTPTIWIVVGTLLFLLVVSLMGRESGGEQLGLTGYERAVEDGRVATAVIHDGDQSDHRRLSPTAASTAPPIRPSTPTTSPPC